MSRGRKIAVRFPIKGKYELEIRPMNNDIVCSVKNLTKRFTGLTANDGISLDIYRNEILAIIGENGAGKSTFCKMLTGVYQPSEGQIFVNGEEKTFRSVADSMAAGINMVYQERNIIGLLNGAQNICFGSEPHKGTIINEKEAMEKALAIREKLSLKTPLDVYVEQLGAGDQQLIEIMRALYNEPHLLILDEPTASLGEGEVEPFLDFLKEQKAKLGISIIFISHKIEEVFAIADRVAVFTDGKCTLFAKTTEVSQDECIRAMLRSDKVAPLDIPARNVEELETIASVTTANFDDREHQLNITMRLGEVIGCYGLVGSGRTEAFEALCGLRKMKSCDFTYEGEKIMPKNSNAMIKRGMTMTPEKRADGIYKSQSLVDNICNLFLDKGLATGLLGLVNFKKSREFADEVLKKNLVKYTDRNQSIVELSGGNIQKIIIGRTIQNPHAKVLVFDEPTAGIDIGAKYEIYKMIRSLAENDLKAVVFISSELDELLAVCDELYVFADGNVINKFKRDNFDKTTILETAIRGKVV